MAADGGLAPAQPDGAALEVGDAGASDEGPLVSRETVSVLIAQWGKTELTVRAVDAVRRSRYDGEIEIRIYDNASPGGPGPVAERNDVTLLRGDENIGFGPAINALAAGAAGRYLLILNNDTIVDPRCIATLVDRIDQPDRPGAVTPQYRSFDGEALEMGGYLGRNATGWQLFRGVRPPHSLLRTSFPAHYGSAACLLVDAELYNDYGGFDDIYAPAYYEDADLAFAFAARGRPTVVEPNAVVFHFEGGTAGKDVTSGLKSYQVRNQTVFVERWRDTLAPLPPISYNAAVTHALTPRDGHRVLWLTPHLPRPDRDAGGARLVQMAGSLVEAGNLVGIWAEHSHDTARYGPMLEAQGILWFAEERTVRPGVPPSAGRVLSQLHDLLSTVQWDVVVFQFPDLAARFMPLVRTLRPEAAVVADPVDLHYLREERAGSLGIGEHDAAAAKAMELETYRIADGVVTASDHETGVLAEEIPGIAVHTFAMSAEPPVAKEQLPLDGDLLFLGNFHHRPNVDAVEWWVSEIGPEVERIAGTPIRMRVVGSGSDGYRESWPDRHLELAGWVEDLSDEFDRARVFLAPLRFGAGTKGKITAALAHGLPTVTTSIGAEGQSPAVLEALRVSDDAAEIAAVVVELMTDDAAAVAGRDASIGAAEAAWGRQQALYDEFADWVRRRIVLKA
jgi:GT2 family glycosyltransferase